MTEVNKSAEDLVWSVISHEKLFELIKFNLNAILKFNSITFWKCIQIQLHNDFEAEMQNDFEETDF